MTNHVEDEYGVFGVDKAKAAQAAKHRANKMEKTEAPAAQPLDPCKLDEFRQALATEWDFVLEHQPKMERLFVRPMIVYVGKRDSGLSDLLASRLIGLLMRHRKFDSDILPVLSQVEWFRFQLLSVIYNLVRYLPDRDDARALLQEINTQLETWGLSDRSYLLPLMNAYLGVHLLPKPVDGIVVASAIGGGSDKSRDEAILDRFEGLTGPMPLVPVARTAADIALALDVEFPWMVPVTRRLCAHIEEQQRYGLSGPVLRKPVLLVGDPGSGKTYYARRFAELTKVPFRLLSIGGMNDNMVLKGSARHWSGSRPSAVAEFIAESGCPNPLFILDEVDKSGTSKTNGNPHDTLIQLLEPRNASSFFDECLLTSLDLSQVSYLATANGTQDLPDPLKDRMAIWQIPSPQPDHLVEVAIRLWWQHWQKLGLHTSQAPAPDVELLKRLIVKAPSIRQVKVMVDAVVSCARREIDPIRVH